MKKFLRSRKFWIVIIVFLLIWVGYYVTMQSRLVTEGNLALLFTACIGATTLFGMAAIGGYVWKDWVKSKHYRPALDDRGPAQIGVTSP